jgi:hypothetical protein
MGKPLCPIYPNDTLIRRLSFRVWLSQTMGEPYPLTLPFPLVVLPKEGQTGSQEEKREQKATTLRRHRPPARHRPLETVVSKCFPQVAGENEIYRGECQPKSDSDLK